MSCTVWILHYEILHPAFPLLRAGEHVCSTFSCCPPQPHWQKGSAASLQMDQVEVLLPPLFTNTILVKVWDQFQFSTVLSKHQRRGKQKVTHITLLLQVEGRSSSLPEPYWHSGRRWVNTVPTNLISQLLVKCGWKWRLSLLLASAGTVLQRNLNTPYYHYARDGDQLSPQPYWYYLDKVLEIPL